jgi:hypothetical protein
LGVERLLKNSRNVIAREPLAVLSQSKEAISNHFPLRRGRLTPVLIPPKGTVVRRPRGSEIDVDTQDSIYAEFTPEPEQRAAMTVKRVFQQPAEIRLRPYTGSKPRFDKI